MRRPLTIMSAFHAIVVGIGCLSATPALAQSPYVALAGGVDMSRFNRAEFNGIPQLEVDGEAFAVAVRTGVEVGPRWGVELEFLRPAAVAAQHTQDDWVVPRPGFLVGTPSLVLLAFSGGQPQFRVNVQRRNTTVSAVASLRQRITSRTEIRYLAGVGFHRFSQRHTVEVVPPARIVAANLPTSPDSVAYNVGPVAGIEAHVTLTEHIRLTPGLQLHGFRNGWILRTSGGIAWSF